MRPQSHLLTLKQYAVPHGIVEIPHYAFYLWLSGICHACNLAVDDKVCSEKHDVGHSFAVRDDVDIERQTAIGNFRKMLASEFVARVSGWQGDR